MHGLLLLAALAAARAFSFRGEPLAECSHDREAAFRSIQDGTGSVWLFHVTHNAGTSLINMMRQRKLVA